MPPGPLWFPFKPGLLPGVFDFIMLLFIPLEFIPLPLEFIPLPLEFIPPPLIPLLPIAPELPVPLEAPVPAPAAPPAPPPAPPALCAQLVVPNPSVKTTVAAIIPGRFIYRKTPLWRSFNY
jgi:hypothetical protein